MARYLLAACSLLIAAVSSAAEPPAMLKAPFDGAAAQSSQKQWASFLHREVVETNSVGMKMTLVPPGEFAMGHSGSSKGLKALDSPAHTVKLTRPFYMGTYHVTRGQFKKFADAASYLTTAEADGKGGMGYIRDSADPLPFAQRKDFSWHNTGMPDETDDHPVVNVSWHDAVAFCKWLSAREGKQYRLPTEAQWEYAARAGTTTTFYFGDEVQDVVKFGNLADGALTKKFPRITWTLKGSDGYAFTAPVGSYRPNQFGLYDMIGNAWQWCADWYGKDYYKDPAAGVDPCGPDDGIKRVVRGGSWQEQQYMSNSAFRGHLPSGFSAFDDGFRVVLLISD
jgi:sulfatase modifying factor 1